MTDQINPATETESPVPLKRIFIIGTHRIVEDASTAHLSNEAVRNLLRAQFPEIANATIRETTSGDTKSVSFLPQPGRKG